MTTRNSLDDLTDDLRAQTWPMAPQGEQRDKIALVLAGGGITGVVYEVGALRAIDDMLVGLTVNDFDIYVGTSAGALVSSFICNGFTPRDVIQIIDNRHPELSGFRVGDIFSLNVDDTLRRLWTLPGTLFNITRSILGNVNDFAIADVLWEAARVLPAGIYDGGALQRYVANILEKPGYTNNFEELSKRLYIVASELDSGSRAVFGPGHIEGVPISKAVAASSAVPVIYRPVQIFEKDYLDGGLQGAASLDLAIEAGAKLVIVINPMVPFDASAVRPHEHYIRQHGLQAVINQSVRTLLHASLRYHIKNLRMKYPDVDIILIQPGLDDLEMFSHNPMHYAGRLAVAEHGFESVTAGLLRNIDYYRSVLARHGIALDTDLARAELAALRASNRDTATMEEIIDHAPSRPSLSSAVSHLEVTLQRLTQYLDDDNSEEER
ncbi:MAG: patatin-like phospholipase family protein, partial [Caldilineaceae bacterium]